MSLPPTQHYCDSCGNHLDIKVYCEKCLDEVERWKETFPRRPGEGPPLPGQTIDP